MPPKAIESYDIDSRNSLLLAVYNYAGKVYYNNLKVKHLFSERGTPKIDGIINLATKVNPGNEQALIEELERYSSRNKSVVEWEENFVFFDERCTPIGTAALGRNKLNLML